MTVLVSFVNEILGVLVIAGQIATVVLLIYFFFFNDKKRTIAFIGKNGIILAFTVSLASTCASLFYSQIAGFVPCELCWFQRIFMYPEVILLGLALIKKESHIIDYALSLSIVGGIISLYHNYIYYQKVLSPFCSIAGKGVSCTTKFVLEFGYITIPMMALTGFLLVIMALIFSKIHIAKTNKNVAG